MKITQTVIDVENRLNQLAPEIAEKIYQQMKGFSGKALKADGSYTAKLKELVDALYITEIKAKVSWRVHVGRYGVKVCVSTYGIGPADGRGGHEQYNADREIHIGNMDIQEIIWNDNRNDESYSRQYSYDEMRADFEEAERLEKVAKDLKARYSQITTIAYFTD